jgi:hypothetical protein
LNSLVEYLTSFQFSIDLADEKRADEKKNQYLILVEIRLRYNFDGG